MTRIGEVLGRIGHAFKRVNQVVLSFPIWIVLGLAGLFGSHRHDSGWQESDTDIRYDRMY